MLRKMDKVSSTMDYSCNTNQSLNRFSMSMDCSIHISRMNPYSSYHSTSHRCRHNTGCGCEPAFAAGNHLMYSNHCCIGHPAADLPSHILPLVLQENNKHRREFVRFCMLWRNWSLLLLPTQEVKFWYSYTRFLVV